MTSVTSVISPARRAQTLAVVGAAVLVELVAARELAHKPVVALAGVLGAAAVGVALWRPRLAFGAALGSLALVPVYATVDVGPVALEPTAVGLWLVAMAVFVRRLVVAGHWRWSVVDVAVLVFWILLATPVIAGLQKRGAYINLVVMWLGPYLGARLFLAQEPSPRRFMRAFVLLALAILPFVVLEVATGHNVFSGLRLSGASDQFFGNQQLRYGQARAQGAFGHPIALSMFLGTAFVLALGAAVHEPRRSARQGWLLAAAVLVVALALTLSRTGFVVIGVGVVLLALATARSRAGGRLLGVIGGVALLLAVVAVALPKEVPSPAALTGEGSAEVTASTSYRQQLLQVALEPGKLTALGTPNRSLADYIGNGSYQSIDNEYLYLAQDWGLVSMSGLLLVVAALSLALWRARRRGAMVVVTATAIANFVALTLVAFITQQQIMVWLLVGAAAGLDARRRALQRAESEPGPAG